MLTTLLYITLLLTPQEMAISKKSIAIKKDVPVKPDPKKPKEVKPIAKKAPKADAWSDSAYVARNYKAGPAAKGDSSVSKKAVASSPSKMYPLSTKDSPSMSGKDIMASRSSRTPSPKAKLEFTSIKKKK